MKRFLVFTTILIIGLFLMTSSAASCKQYCMEKIKGRMNVLRAHMKLVQLDDDRVLVIGGTGPFVIGRNEVETYYPEKDKFEITGTMHFRRQDYFSATKLQDGRVLIIGGLGSSAKAEGIEKDKSDILDSVEVYNPKTGEFNELTPFPIPIYKHTAILLSNGQVMIIGGNTAPPKYVLDDVWIFDPQSEKVTNWGKLQTPRANSTAILMDDNKVLVTGGLTAFKDTFGSFKEKYVTPIVIDSQAHKIDEINNEFPVQNAYKINSNKYLLTNGGAMFFGKMSNNQLEIEKSIVSDIWRTNPHIGFLLENKMLLIAGGEYYEKGQAPPNVIEIFNPLKNKFIKVSRFNTYRTQFSSILLKDGRVLFLGGFINWDMDDTGEVLTVKR